MQRSTTSTMARFIDIAVNLTDPMFKGIYRSKQAHQNDFKHVLDRSFSSANIDKIMITGTNLQDSKEALEMVEEDPRLYMTCGVHPTRCGEFEDTSLSSSPDAYLNELRKIIQSDLHKSQTTHSRTRRIVAIGECGLDYDRTEFCTKEIQQKYFAKQFILAKEAGLPMFFHNRNSTDDFIKIVSEHRSMFSTGVVHSFDGSLEDGLKIIKDLNLYIGINGCSLKTEENLQVVQNLPLEYLMIETDAPWCDIRPTHASYKHIPPSLLSSYEWKKKEKFELGKMVKGRNEPRTIAAIAHVIASLKGVSLDVVAGQVYRNTVKVFFSQENRH